MGKGRNSVALREIEGLRSGTNDPPLHRVFRFDHIEFSGEGFRVGGFFELIGAHGCSDQHPGAGGLFTERLPTSGADPSAGGQETQREFGS
jgi:hypothetical protein